MNNLLIKMIKKKRELIVHVLGKNSMIHTMNIEEIDRHSDNSYQRYVDNP